jgi:hypothetical protein
MHREQARREPIGDAEAAEHDFAAEHDDTTVDPQTSSGDNDGETESPRGLGGMDMAESPPD